MQDLISRQAALDCFHDWIDRRGDVHTPDEMAEYRAIEELPSVQPEQDCILKQFGNCSYSETGCSDCAIKVKIRKALPSAQPYTEAEIQKMQELEQAELQKAYECGRASAQPEIIRCKDCRKHNVHSGYKDDCCPLYEWRGMSYGHEHDYQYCCHAERRTDEQ